MTEKSGGYIIKLVKITEDSTGAVVAEYDYTAYGKELYNAGAYYVKNTGRYFNKYRSLKYWTEELTMTAAEAIATSDFAKYRFYVIFGGK